MPKPDVALTEDVVTRTRVDCSPASRRPKYVVVADALPKNPSGKILKRQLREEHADLA